MKLFALVLIVATGVFAQAPPKSRMNGVKGSVTLQAAPILQDGHWYTQILLSSPNTDSFKICFRYFDGTTMRNLIKAAASYETNVPVSIIIELPMEIVETGGVIVYEMTPMTVTGFDVH